MSTLNCSQSCEPKGTNNWERDRKVLEKKKKTLPAAPHPQQQRLISPSLQQPAMMAGAEEGQGAILSTHKCGQQPWKPLIPSLESNRKLSMILNSSLAPTAIVQSLGRNGGASTCHFHSTGRFDASPRTESLAQETRMAQRGERPGAQHSLLGGKGVGIRVSVATRLDGDWLFF